MSRRPSDDPFELAVRAVRDDGPSDLQVEGSRRRLRERLSGVHAARPSPVSRVGPPRVSRSRLALWLGAGGAVAAAAAVGLLLVGRPRVHAPAVSREPSDPSSMPDRLAGGAVSPGSTEEGRRAPTTPAAPTTEPQRLERQNPSQRSRADLHGEIVASEGAAFAQRKDLYAYAAFENWQVLPSPFAAAKIGKIDLVPGLVGTALRVRPAPRDSVPYAGLTFVLPVRAPLADGVTTRQQALDTQPPGPAPVDDLSMRFHVWLTPGFEFGKGGVLPGLLATPRQETGEGNEHGQRYVSVHFAWRPTGHLALIIEGAPGAKQSVTLPDPITLGRWHALALRVKLNTPDASDGTVEAWMDDVKVATLAGLRLRDDPALHLNRVLFRVRFPRPAPGSTGSASEILFDNLAAATGHLAARRP